jgi:hypothetical protein
MAKDKDDDIGEDAILAIFVVDEILAILLAQ